MQIKSRLGSEWNRWIAAVCVVVPLAGTGCVLSQEELEDTAEVENSTHEINADLDALFQINLSPASQSIEVADTAFIDVNVLPLEGFIGNVTLGVVSEPPFIGDVHIFSEVVTPPAFASLHAHSFCDTATGTYDFTVTGTGDDGSTTSASALVTVNPSPPQASFFTSRDGFAVQFFDGSFSFCEPIVAWAWDFGDGAVSDEENPLHTYDERGDYTVTLTVTDSQGLTDTASGTITVLPPPPVLAIEGVTRKRDVFEFRVDLSWSGAEGQLVELHRNNQVVDLPNNDGVHRDRFRSLQTSFTWSICELGIFFCSNQVRLDVGPNFTGSEATVTTVIDGETIVKKIPIVDE